MTPWLLGGFDPTTAAATGGSLVYQADGAWIGIVVGLAVLALGLAFVSMRPGPARWGQVLLLAPALAALSWALARPSWVEISGYQEPARFVVLLDDSRSMAVREGAGRRGDAVEGILAAVGRPDAEVLRFGATLEVGGAPSWDQPDTDLAGALQALTERYAGERLAGIALVSDGLDASGLRRDWRAGQALPRLELPGPLTVYGVGTAADLRDLAVQDVATGGFAFIRAPFSLTATVSGPGQAGLDVPVTVSQDGSFKDRKTVRLDARGLATVTFELTPERVGRFTYEVSVPVQEGDAVPGNNTWPVVVRVVRDRLRVLQVCGSPSADQKFLRLFLKEDPAVDLVSFFIMRTEADMNAGYDADELSLIPFPYDQLFSTDLWTFDLVFFQNFDYAPYFGYRSSQLLANVADWVQAGGAFVMMGGDRSFDLGEYARSPIADVLPVELGVTGDPVDLATFQPTLTEAGLRHPVTTLAGEPEESAATWARLAPLDGLNLVRGAVPGATVLLRHPSLVGADDRPLPVLAVRTVGKGRSLAFMGDSSWRWSFAEAGRGRGNQAYLRFWKQAIRWLVADPDAERVTVDTTLENYRVGEEVRLLVRVRDPGYRPLGGVTVTGRATGPSFTARDEDAGTFSAVTNAEGEATVTLPATRSGAHRARVTATERDGRPFFEGETVWAVTTREPEMEEIVPDPAFLAALAASVGGTFHPAANPGTPTVDPDAGRWVEDQRETPLSGIPLLPVVVALFGSASWWVRRRGGGR